jgi:hypothetical protein
MARIERSQVSMQEELDAAHAELATYTEALLRIVELNDGTPAIDIARVALGLPDEGAPKSKRSLGSALAKVDATTDEDIARQIATDPDTAPELTDEELDAARPARGAKPRPRRDDTTPYS